MNEDDKDTHQLHITIPKVLYEELKLILPEWGAISSLTRNLLQKYVVRYNSEAKGSPSETAVDHLINKQKRREDAENI